MKRNAFYDRIDEGSIRKRRDGPVDTTTDHSFSRGRSRHTSPDNRGNPAIRAAVVAGRRYGIVRRFPGPDGGGFPVPWLPPGRMDNGYSRHRRLPRRRMRRRGRAHGDGIDPVPAWSTTEGFARDAVVVPIEFRKPAIVQVMPGFRAARHLAAGGLGAALGA